MASVHAVGQHTQETLSGTYMVGGLQCGEGHWCLQDRQGHTQAFQLQEAGHWWSLFAHSQVEAGNHSLEALT